jgi:hypothetical protein
MKRVLFCAFLCILLIGNVSALNLTKTVVAATQQIIVKPSVYVTFSPSATPTQIQYGSLEVYSDPSEANVGIFDNQMEVLVNSSTPLYRPILPLGTFNIIISHPGYRYYIGTITILNGQTTVVSETLVPLSAPTSAATVSPTPTTQSDNIPTNAPVTTQQGVSQTPASPTDTPPANTPATLQQEQAQPTSSGSTGSLSVTSTPAGAEVSVDNEVKGITPAMVSGLSAGTHTLKITKEGYRDFSTTMSIEAGKVQEYSTGLTSASTTPANSLGFPVFAAIIALIGLVIVRKGSR